MKKRAVFSLLILVVASLALTLVACDGLRARLATPTVEVTVVECTSSSIAFDVKVKDDFDLGAISKIELIGGQAVSLDDLTVRRFDGLLSNSEYSVRVTYTYDLNDGKGAREIVKTASATTLAKATPTVEITNLWVTESVIKADLAITDQDSVGALDEIKLVGKNTSVANGKVIYFDGLTYGETYEITVTYKYDLSDGKGEQTLIKKLPVTVDNETIHQTSCKLDYEVINGGCRITGCSNCVHESVHVPQIIDGYAVIAIDQYAFRDCATFTTVVIPKSVTEIGYGAFYSCVRLTSVTFNSAATLIEGAFRECSSLQTVTFASDVKLKTIGSSTFSGCSKLQSITIPETVTSIGSQAFYGCTRLQSVTIPKDVAFIGNGVFIGCSNLEKVAFEGNRLTSIGDNAFYSCDSLASIVIPEGVTDVGANAFYGCDILAAVTIPQSVTYIGSGAFAHCPKLNTVYYGGTEAQWVRLTANDSTLTSIEPYYFSATPQLGKWHFDTENNPTLWKEEDLQ